MSEMKDRLVAAVGDALVKMDMGGNEYLGSRDGDRIVVDAEIDLRVLATAAIEALRPELEMARDHIIGSTGARPGSDSAEVVDSLNQILAK